MAYYGNQPIAGETNSFKVLDDISSYTKTFDGSSAAVVSTSDDTLTFYDHRFIQGQRVTYGKGSGGTVVTGLTDATVYYVIREDKDTIKLATSASNAAGLTAVNLTGVGGGTSHELTVAFDGTNTKFKATTGGGTHIKLTRPGQLMISMNGVVQEPQNNTPTNGFGIESNNVIVFSTAPTVLDTFWGHYLTTNLSSWEMSDNKVDNFTGNASTTTYTLSKTPANAENILVTVDGVIQYPSESGTTRAYTLNASVVTFTTAPALNAAIQVRHIGFAGGGAGGGSGGVTGFYGRTGNVSVIRSDLQNTDINLKNLTGVAATFTGNVAIGGTLTYTDVTNIDSIGIVTAQKGINVLTNGINVQAGVSTFAGDIDANADIELAGNLAVTGVSTFTAAANFDNAITVDGSVGIADSIIHLGNTDTSIRFPSDDTFAVETAGTERLKIQSDGIKVVKNGRLNILSTFIDFSGNVSTPQTGAAIFRPAADTLAVSLNNVERVRFTSSGNLKLPDSAKIELGGAQTGSGVLSIWHNTSHSLIKNTTGRLYVLSDDLWFKNEADDSNLARFINGGEALLYNSGNLRLETSGTGIKVTGTKIEEYGSGEVQLMIGSTNAGGAAIYFDGDSDGNFVGSDYSWIRHTTGGDLEYVVDNPAAAGNHIFKTGGTAERLRINSDGTIRIGTQANHSATVKFADSSRDDAVTMKVDNSDDSDFDIVNNRSSGDITLATNSAERLRISSSNSRIGINTTTWEDAGVKIAIDGRNDGTTSPPRIQLKGNGNGNVHAYLDLVATSDNNTSGGYRGLGVAMFDEVDNHEWFAGTPYTECDAYVIGRKASPSYRTQSAELANQVLKIISTGHMGLGVAPSAWATNADFKALQVGTGIAVFGRGSGDEDRGGIAANYYHTGSQQKYIGNGHAGRMYFEDGSIVFSNTGATANSSGAGAAMTLYERLRITSVGHVNIGGVSPSSSALAVKLATDKHIAFSPSQGEVGSVPALVAFQDNGSLADMGFRGTTLRFATGSAERLRIDSNGDMFLRGDSTCYLVMGSSGDATSGGANNNMNWIRGNGTNVQYNCCGGFHAWENSGGEKMKLNGANLELTSASQCRITLGSDGTAGTNDSNWIRGDSNNLMFNCADTSGEHIFECAGTAKARIYAGVGVRAENTCKAWVCYKHDGGTSAIHDDFYVTTVTDEGTGIFGIQFDGHMGGEDKVAYQVGSHNWTPMIVGGIAYTPSYGSQNPWWSMEDDWVRIHLQRIDTQALVDSEWWNLTAHGDII